MTARPAAHLHRVTAACLRAPDGGPEVALRGDAASLAVLALSRGAVAPLSTSGAGFPDLTAQASVADFIATLAPESAAARLITEGVRVDLTGRQSASIPARVGPAGGAARVVGEGQPIPVGSIVLNGVVVRRAKVAAVGVLTNELATSPAAPAALEALLREDAAPAMDRAVLFNDPNAYDEPGPAGVLLGAAEVVAAAAGSDAMLADVEALGAAVLAAGGVRVAYLAGPQTAFRLQLRLPQQALTVWPSLAMAEGSLAAIDPAAFISGVDPRPRIDVADQTVLHMEDAAPAQIGTPGAPSTVAAPSRSLFQTDAQGLKLTLELGWGMRAPAVAIIPQTNW